MIFLFLIFYWYSDWGFCFFRDSYKHKYLIPVFHFSTECYYLYFELPNLIHLKNRYREMVRKIGKKMKSGISILFQWIFIEFFKEMYFFHIRNEKNRQQQMQWQQMITVVTIKQVMLEENLLKKWAFKDKRQRSILYSLPKLAKLL